jgi:outer membrane protein TolC
VLVAAPPTLEQALQLAEARSESIGAARAGIAGAEGDIVRARSGLFPQLSAAASYDRALASEFEGLFDRSQGPACEPFALNSGAPLEARVGEIERAIDCGAIGNSFFGGQDSSAGDLPFGRTNTDCAKFKVTRHVCKVRLRTPQAGHEIAELTLDSTRAQFLFDVTRAYFDAALSDELVSIAKATIEQAEATYRLVRAAYDAGTEPEFELLRARVERDNQRPALIRQRANREVALLRLKQLLDLPASAPLRLAVALDAPALAPPRAFASRLALVGQMLGVADLELPDTGNPVDVAPSAQTAGRVAVRSVAAGVALRTASLAAARAERMPNVSLNSSYGRVAYPSGFFPGSTRFERTGPLAQASTCLFHGRTTARC